MTIIIINGSLRINGSTAYILHKIEKVLLKQGADVTFYNLSEQNIALCKGCCACYKTGHCIINDDAEKISQELRNIDGVVIGSSTIASNIPGILKTFIDRGHFVIEQLLNKQYALCVTTYENYGGNKASAVLKSLVTLSGAKLSGRITKKVPFNSDCSSDNKLNRQINKHALKFFNDIKDHKPYFLQKIKQKIVINIGLKPFILRKGNSYKGVQRRWFEIGLLKQSK